MRTKETELSRRFYYVSSGDASCGSSPILLNRESPSKPHFRRRILSTIRNINKGNYNRQHQRITNSINPSRIPATRPPIPLNVLNKSEMLDIMIFQYSSLCRGIKRFGFPARQRCVNSNDDGLVMCSTCYYYTKVGESCWHCGNSC